jgi:hypothetical protein
MIYLLAILCLVVPQDTKTATRQEKTEYNAAVAKCKDGESMIDSDPQAAIERFSELIGNSKLRAIECMLRIEQRPAEYSEPYAFLPYQYRARARMNLAKKASPENAQKLIAGAIEDFQESEKRNVAPSAEMRKAAEGVLARLKADVTKPPDTVKADPVAKFKEKWDPLMVAKRFKSAKAVIDKDSEGLTEEQKKGFLESTEQKCRSGLISWVSEFRPRFLSAVSAGLDQKTADEFDELFALPAARRADRLQSLDRLAPQIPPDLPRGAVAEIAPARAHRGGGRLRPAGGRRQQPLVPGPRGRHLPEPEGRHRGRGPEGPERRQGRSRQGRASRPTRSRPSGRASRASSTRSSSSATSSSRTTRASSAAFSTDSRPTWQDLEKINLDSAFSAESPDAELSKIEAVLSNFESKGQPDARIAAAPLHPLGHRGGPPRALRRQDGGRGRGRPVGVPPEAAGRGRAGGDVKKYGPRVEKVFAALR